MTIENDETSDAVAETDVDNQIMVAAGDSDSFERITGDMSADINNNFQEALGMHAKLNESYLGYRYSIRFPSSCEATIQPEMFPEAIQEKYRDEKLKLGKMDTMPTWLKKIGTSIRGSVTSKLLKSASNTDTRFGYMIKLDSFNDVEAHLLSIKGIANEDRNTFAGTDIVSTAEDLITAKRSKASEWEVMRDAPVTYLEYIAYFQEHYNTLREEIIAEYNRIFDSDVVDVITSLIPSRESFSNPKRIRFDWYRTQEVPSCVLQGNTTYRQIADRVHAGRELQHELSTIREREVESWKQQTIDSVADIQMGIRSMLAKKVSSLKRRLDQTPMSEGEMEEARDGGKQRIVDPSRITTAAIDKLIENIDELTSELGQFETTDQFYQAITEFKRTLGFETNLDDESVRQQLSQDIDHIVELSLDDSSINPRTGEFFSSLIY